MYDLNFFEESRILGENNVVSELVCKTLFAWEEAVSPHLAAERESGVLGDSEVVETLGKCLRDGLQSEKERMEILCVVETAGGVASPGPSGSLQCDLYRQVIVLLFLANPVAFSFTKYMAELTDFFFDLVALDESMNYEFKLLSYIVMLVHLMCHIRTSVI